jgi:hypothetical protein
MVATNHRTISNIPPLDVVARLRILCTDFLEPIRYRFGPLRVSSGYRSPELNTAVGGSKSSAHTFGCAVDFVPVAQISLDEIIKWIIASKLPFDQVIDEATSTDKWIHLGMLRPGFQSVPRKEALVMRNGKYTKFGG